MILADGREVSGLAVYPRDDIGAIFWYVDGARMSGFSGRVPLKGAVDRGAVTLSFADRATGRPFNPDNNYYYKVQDDASPFPSPERRRRVHGGSDLSGFRLEGYTAWRKLEIAVERYFGRTFADFESMLDWGCGCGRVARHFVDGPAPQQYTGADIDVDNIAWCKDNLRRGGLENATFISLPLHPPTPLPSSGYDLLIGTSVFTHLREREQFEWLAELARVAAPGAVLLMSVLSDASVCRSKLPAEMLATLLARGFLDAGSNPDLQGAIADETYYKNVFHTQGYIAQNWGKMFNIKGIIPGYIGNHQDLVVMTAR
jgi:ubiquinone/menaquinone biosynthesis C-methylase UbiE